MFETPIFDMVILDATENFATRNQTNFSVKGLKYNFVRDLSIILQLEV